MKTAIIIVGEHASGKSVLIKKFIKKSMKMKEGQRITSVNNKSIYVKSQTLQEAKLSINDLEKYNDYDILIIPSWPNNQGSPTLAEITVFLATMGFRVEEIAWVRSQGEKVYISVIERVLAIVNEKS